MIERIQLADLTQDCLVPFKVVVRVARTVLSFSLAEAERVCDEIHEKHPAAMAHVVVLSRRGVPFPLIDHALHLLMVIYSSFKEAGVPVSAIGEEKLYKAWGNNLAMASFFEDDENEEERDRLHRLSLTSYPEPYLLAYTVGYLRDEVLVAGPSVHAELVIGVAKSLLDSFVQASREAN